MRKLVLAAFAASLATSAIAQDEMTVRGNPGVEAWVDHAERALDQALADTNIYGSESGVTFVRFNCDEDGKPTNIKTSKYGRHQPRLARVGRRAVSRIDTLHPLFKGAEPDQMYEAAIIVADNEQQLRKLRAAVEERAERENSRWAARGVPNPVVSLAIVGAF